MAAKSKNKNKSAARRRQRFPRRRPRSLSAHMARRHYGHHQVASRCKNPRCPMHAPWKGVHYHVTCIRCQREWTRKTPLRPVGRKVSTDRLSAAAIKARHETRPAWQLAHYSPPSPDAPLRLKPPERAFSAAERAARRDALRRYRAGDDAALEELR